MELTIKMLAPLLLVVASNVTYQLLCKNTPASLNPFTGLFASYGVSCLLCLVLMLVTKQGGSERSCVRSARSTSYWAW